MSFEQKGIKKEDVSLLKRLLSTEKRIVITTHQKPDADALGSSLALALFLKKKGHIVQVITPTDYPEFLNWLPGNDEVIVFSDKTKEASKDLVAKSELIFCLDFNGLSRIAELGGYVKESSATKILIDHHLEPEDFADILFWDIKSAATSELLFDLMVEMGETDLIDADIANCLYSGIMTDTGNFKHPNVTPNVFKICGELLSLGADTAFVARSIYDNSSLDKLKLLGFSLKERLVVLPELSAAYITLSSKDLEDFNSQTGDTEGLVNYALSVKGVNLAALFMERKGFVKMSFRSVGDISVNAMARKYFNGGGHKNAAGGQTEDTLEKTLNLFLKVLPEFTMEMNL